MTNSRPVIAVATLGSTLLLGAWFGGQAVTPAPPTVSTVPSTVTPSPKPETASPDPTTSPLVAPPVAPSAPAAPATVPSAVVAPPAPPAPAPPVVVAARREVKETCGPCRSRGGAAHQWLRCHGPEAGDGEWLIRRYAVRMVSVRPRTRWMENDGTSGPNGGTVHTARCRCGEKRSRECLGGNHSTEW